MKIGEPKKYVRSHSGATDEQIQAKRKQLHEMWAKRKIETVEYHLARQARRIALIALFLCLLTAFGFFVSGYYIGKHW